MYCDRLSLFISLITKQFSVSENLNLFMKKFFAPNIEFNEIQLSLINYVIVMRVLDLNWVKRNFF